MAKPAREMSERLQAVTLPELLNRRFDSPGLKTFAAAIIFIFLVPYSASVFMGLSYVIEEVFLIDYNLILLMMALITAALLMMGGFKAVAITDFILGLVMLFGIVLFVWCVFNNPAVGGFSQAAERLAAIDPQLAMIFPSEGTRALSLASLILLTSMGTWGLPQMIQKFFAIKEVGKIKAATWISTLFALIIGCGAYGAGSVVHLFFKELPVDPITGKATVDLLMPKLIASAVPEFLGILIVLLILSASISTLSSLVLVSSSSLTMDLIKPRLAPNMTKAQEIFLLRLFCVVFIGLSFIIAYMKPVMILNLMALSWGTVAGVFLGPFLWGLFWMKTTRLGAWAGALGGLATSLGVALISGFNAAYVPIGGAAAMLVSLILVPTVSLITQGFTKRHLVVVFRRKLSEVMESA
jgi:SSS family transporter